MGREDRERAALVALAALPHDQAPGFHPVDLVREPAAGLGGPVGKLGHPHPAARRLGELDEDLVIVHGQPEGMQVPVELAHEKLCQAYVGAPRALFLFGEPARGAGPRGTVSKGLCRHTKEPPGRLPYRIARPRARYGVATSGARINPGAVTSSRCPRPLQPITRD